MRSGRQKRESEPASGPGWIWRYGASVPAADLFRTFSIYSMSPSLRGGTVSCEHCPKCSWLMMISAVAGFCGGRADLTDV